MVNKQVDLRGHAISSRKADPEWNRVIKFCKENYGYEFLGVNSTITTQMSGECQFLYFADQEGIAHCLSTSKFTRRTTERPPLFSW